MGKPAQEYLTAIWNLAAKHTAPKNVLILLSPEFFKEFHDSLTILYRESAGEPKEHDGSLKFKSATVSVEPTLQGRTVILINHAS
jgi:hypothetical protein